MSGRIARHLRKVAQVNSIGASKGKTRQLYQRLKVFYKSLNK